METDAADGGAQGCSGQQGATTLGLRKGAGVREPRGRAHRVRCAGAAGQSGRTVASAILAATTAESGWVVAPGRSRGSATPAARTASGRPS
jgi:hypothetical protein